MNFKNRGSKYEMEPKNLNNGITFTGNGYNSSPQKDAKEPETQTEFGTSWRNIAHDFMQNSTLHGLNKISEDQPFKMRRFLWIAIVVTGAALFTYQAMNSVVMYYSRPVSVNVKVNYNETLTFPAVTICNHNDFRLSRVADLGLHEKLVEMFKERANTKDNESKGIGSLVHDGRTGSLHELTMSYLLKEAGHAKEDLIVGCTWAGKACKDDDFEQVLTDYGVCFTFNGHKSNEKIVTQQGSGGGLRLKINIEQYEYMPGPSDGAGLKILIHTPNEFPLVKFQGQAIPPGSHSLVGISLLEAFNLKQPYGKCDDGVKLEYFPYSVASCQTECKQRLIKERCKCRDFYLKKHSDDDPQECTIQQLVDCVNPLMASLGADDAQCHCPIKCDQMVYNPLITGGILSDLDKDKILNNDDAFLSNLTSKYINAREKQQWFDKELMKNDRLLVTDMIREIEEIDNVIKTVNNTIGLMIEMVTNNRDALFSYTKVHNYLLDYVDYDIKHNFNRGYNVLNERYFQWVAQKYIVQSAEIGMLFDILDGDDAPRKKYAANELKFKLKSISYITDLARTKMDKVSKGYTEPGNPVSVYKYFRIEKYDYFFSPPCFFPLTNKTELLYFEKIRLAASYIEGGINETASLLHRYMADGNNNTNTTYRQDWEPSRKRFEKGARSYIYYTFMINDRIVAATYNDVANTIARFRNNVKLFKTFTDNIITYAEELLNNIGNFEPYHKQMLNLKKYAENYLVDANSMKTGFSKQIIGESIQVALLKIKELFSLFRLRDANIRDNLASTITTADIIAEQMTDKCTNPFYELLVEDLKSYEPQHTNSSKCIDIEKVLHKITDNDIKYTTEYCRSLRRNFTQEELIKRVNVTSELLTDINMILRNVSLIPDLRTISNSADEKIIDHFRTYRKYFQAFLDKNELTTDFVRDNFMNVDVFMRELSYEEVTQQIGYTQTNLWSDIGGSMGLFIGASVITVFELFDAIINRGFIERRLRRRAAPTSEVPNIDLLAYRVNHM